MALTVTNLGTNRTATTATTATLTLGASVAVNDLIVVACAIDNYGTSGAAPGTLTPSATKAASWVVASTVLSDPGTASSGAYLAVWVGVATEAWTTSDTITVTSNTAAASAITAWKVSPATNKLAYYDAQDTLTNNTTTTYTTRSLATGASVSVGNAVLGFAAVEAGNSGRTMTVTGDSDTTNGSWTTVVKDQGNSNNTSTNNMTLITQGKVQTTAASTQTWDPSWGTATDGVAMALLRFKEADPVIPNVPIPFSLLGWMGDPSQSASNGVAQSSWRNAGVFGSLLSYSEATGANQPIYRSSVAALNNKPGLEVDGSNDNLESTIFATMNAPITVGSVVALDATQPNSGTWYSIASGYESRLIYDATSKVAVYAQGSNQQIWNGNPAGLTIHAYYVSNGASSKAYVEKSDGTVLGSGTLGASPGTGTTTRGVIGAWDGNGSNAFKGHQALHYVYDGDLSAHSSYNAFLSWFDSEYAAGTTHQATATGTSTSTGSAAADLYLGASATGTSTSTGSAAPTATFSPTATGTSTSTGTAAASAILVASGTASSTSTGTATAGAVLAATASGTSSSTGSAAATVGVAAVVHQATATGTSTSTGQATATALVAATATGTSTSTGSAAVTALVAAAASATSTSTGSAAVTALLVAAASATATSTGQATGTALLVATATGTSTSTGSADASIVGASVLSATATATSTSTGSAAARRLPGALAAIPWHTAVWAGDTNWSAPADGAAVASWDDFSGNGRNLSQGTAGARPTMVATDSALNSKPSVSLDGGDYIGTTFTAVNQPISLVAVVYIDPTQPLSNGTLGSLGAPWLRFSPSATIDFDDSGAATSIYASDPRGQRFILVGVWNGASSKWRVNATTGTLSRGSTDTANQFWIGDEYGDGARPLKGKVAFQGFYAGDITVHSGYTDLLTWLGAEYNIATTTVHSASATASSSSTGSATASLGGTKSLPFEAPNVTYDAAITITTGGTYSNLNVAGITVSTTDPVVIKNCNVKATGRHLIVASVSGVRLTVKNCWLEGSATRDDSGWRAVRANNPTYVIVEHNDFYHTTPVKVTGNTSVSEVRIRYNRVRDVVGDETNTTGGGFAPCFQMAGESGAFSTPVGEVEWNEVVNLPGQSNQEDFFNVFAASGSDTNHPIRVHDNFVWGAYPWPISDTYSGGGILTGDGGGGTNHIFVYDNQLVGCANYGIQIGGGDDNHFTRNRVVASGQISDGTPIPSMNTNPFWTYNTAPTNCSMTDNVVALMRPPNGYYEPNNPNWPRVDWWTPAAGSNGNVFSGNTSLTSDPNARIYYADEEAEWDLWVDKVATAQRVLGRYSEINPASATATSSSSGSATATLVAKASATATSTSTGSAAATIVGGAVTHAATATATSSSTGQATPGMVCKASATALTTSTGTAAATISGAQTWTLTASGTSVSSGTATAILRSGLRARLAAGNFTAHLQVGAGYAQPAVTPTVSGGNLRSHLTPGLAYAGLETTRLYTETNMEPIPTGSSSYIYTNVTTMTDPTAGAVSFAFLPTNSHSPLDQPDVGDWQAGAWFGATRPQTSGKYKSTARVLVGSGGVVTAAGTYHCWVKVGSDYRRFDTLTLY